MHAATQAPEWVAAMVLSGAPSYFPAQARAIIAMFGPDNRSEDDWRSMRERHRHSDEQIRALWRIGQGFKDSHHDMSVTPPLLATIRARTLM